MAYIRMDEARAVGRAAVPLQKSARTILAEQARAFDAALTYDIFLSHSFEDAEVIYGVKRMIEALRLSVYVDWIEDRALDRGKVTVKTAAVLRERMKACSSLVYAHSANSSSSVWMPWELGYFDGIKPGQVWILPLVSDDDSEFKGQEYLALYPPVEKLSNLARPHDAGVRSRRRRPSPGSAGECRQGQRRLLRSEVLMARRVIVPINLLPNTGRMCNRRRAS